MTAEILSIGDELLIGQVINTNQAYIAERLNGAGVTVGRMTTVGDEEGVIVRAFGNALSAHDLAVVTGGLGPTHDDLTRSAVCAFYHTDLIQDARAMAHIREVFARRNIPLIKINEDQSLVPRGCTVIQNPVGTAPGYLFDKEGRIMVVLPGVPSEMRAMMEGFVIPYVEKKAGGSVIRHRTLKTTGIAESILADRIGDIGAILPPGGIVTLAFLPSFTGVRLRITAHASSPDEADTAIATVETRLREKASKYVYGTDEEELEDVVGKLLRDRRRTIAVAESCTGGLIADRLTNVPGSSDYFDRGMIVYSNDAKYHELSVPTETVARYGAVSRETAEAMASGIRLKANTDIGLSTTGIAGPSGGTAEKPVGLLWVGYADREKTFALRFDFGEGRRRVKERGAQAALELVRRTLLNID